MARTLTFLGIEFVALSWRQFLEAVAILQWSLLFGYGAVVLLLMSVVMLVIPPLTVVSLGLWAWTFYDRRTPERGGRRSDWVRRWTLWTYCRNYFPISLRRTAVLDPERNYLLLYHPHGILSYGAFSNFATSAAGDFDRLFPGLKATILGLKVQFLVPLIRDYFLALGGCSCSRRSIDWLLTRQGVGNAVVLVVGGAAEALEAHRGTYNLTLKNRKGFVRLAIEHGTSLVPVFGFGENDVFHQIANPPGSRLRTFQNCVARLCSFSPPVFRGRGIFNANFGIVPYRRPIDVVVGSPMDVEQINNPSEDQVDAVHERYLDHLTELFEANKIKYGVPKDTQINFI